jgi:hypothetical protein
MTNKKRPLSGAGKDVGLSPLLFSWYPPKQPHCPITVALDFPFHVFCTSPSRERQAPRSGEQRDGSATSHRTGSGACASSDRYGLQIHRCSPRLGSHSKRNKRSPSFVLALQTSRCWSAHPCKSVFQTSAKRLHADSNSGSSNATANGNSLKPRSDPSKLLGDPSKLLGLSGEVEDKFGDRCAPTISTFFRPFSTHWIQNDVRHPIVRQIFSTLHDLK